MRYTIHPVADSYKVGIASLAKVWRETDSREEAEKFVADAPFYGGAIAVDHVDQVLIWDESHGYAVTDFNTRAKLVDQN